MNLPGIDASKITAARARLEAWLGSMRMAGGYGGPVVGLRGTAMAYCGPGHDWRWEGLLYAWSERQGRSKAAAGLERIEQATRELAEAQLLNGAFRNSYFDLNPMEGGMPHEPAVMAALLHAAARPLPKGTDAMLERFVEERLIKELWNKLLKTFNNWLQSEFETYSPPAVAAAIEVLLAYGELTGQAKRLDPYVSGAAESLLKCQFQDGPLAGALPVTNRDRTSASPYMAARCLPALVALHRKTGDERFRKASEALTAFVLRTAQPGGGFAATVHAARPAAVYPLLTGAAAGTLTALHRAAALKPETAAAHLPWILERQTASGAFETGVGFDRRPRRAGACDWRDAIPVCGWNDKAYHLLAVLDDAKDPASPARVESVRRDVRILGRTATFTENAESMKIAGSDGTTWFAWRKGSAWPECCLL
jgi:hypothetical protein